MILFFKIMHILLLAVMAQDATLVDETKAEEPLCTDTLAVVSEVVDEVSKTMSYTSDQASASEIISLGWQRYFTNSDDTNCPIEECTLKKGPDCSSDYTGDVATILNKAPW